MIVSIVSIATIVNIHTIVPITTIVSAGCLRSSNHRGLRDLQALVSACAASSGIDAGALAKCCLTARRWVRSWDNAFHHGGTPKTLDGFWENPNLKWMGYPYFRKPPYVVYSIYFSADFMCHRKFSRHSWRIGGFRSHGGPIQ